MFIVLLTSIINASNHTKYVSLSNQNYETQPTLINLHPNEYSQKLHYYPFAVNLDKYVGSCNTLNDLSNKACVQNKTEDLNMSIFNMITGINGSKTLTKDIYSNVNVKLMWENVIEIKSEIIINAHAIIKDIIYAKKIWNPVTCSSENGKYIAIIIDDSIITCDKS